MNRNSCKGWELLGLAKVWVDRDDAIGLTRKGIEWGEMWLAKCRNTDPHAYPGEYPAEFFVLLSGSNTERMESNWAMMVPGIEQADHDGRRQARRLAVQTNNAIHAKEQEDHQLTQVVVTTQNGDTLTGYKLNYAKPNE